MRKDSHYRRRGSYLARYAWGVDLPLAVKPKKTKKRPTSHKKVSHACLMLKAARTRERRAITIRKKWERKLKDYERRVAQPSTKLAATEDDVVLRNAA